MGGEPTFVAVDDRDGAEWNTDALGPTKRAYATELVHKLRDEYGRAASCTSARASGTRASSCRAGRCRSAGAPTASRSGNPALFADEREPAHYTPNAQRFPPRWPAPGLTRRAAGYEDTWYYLWRERRLPVNVDPSTARRRAGARAPAPRVRPGLERGGLRAAAAPTATAGLAARWQTGPWFLRDERMYLIPGDSPMGYRLPLDSLPWVQGRLPYVEQDPFAPRAAAGGGHAPPQAPGRGAPAGRAARARAAARAPASGAGRGPGAAGRPARPRAAPQPTGSPAPRCAWRRATRAAPTARPRPGQASGVLYVFMPPLASWRTTWSCCRHRGHRRGAGHEVVLEGYPPPRDPRLKLLQVTPDPGVIEVNIHPATTGTNW
jgi:uncharacterized protein (DUF2126 family)